jgi:lipopolysaccharide assembly protein A
MTTEPQPTPVGPGPGDLAPGRPPPTAPEQTAPAQTGPAQTGPAQTAPPPTQTASAQTAPVLPQHKIRRTRISGLWVSVGFFAVVLLLLLIFILQNGTKVDISYMGAHGHLPLGVALLLSAVCGVLLVVLAGAARISQLRTVARRHRRADAKRVTAAQAAEGPVGSTR